MRVRQFRAILQFLVRTYLASMLDYIVKENEKQR